MSELASEATTFRNPQKDANSRRSPAYAQLPLDDLTRSRQTDPDSSTSIVRQPGWATRRLGGTCLRQRCRNSDRHTAVAMIQERQWRTCAGGRPRRAANLGCRFSINTTVSGSALWRRATWARGTGADPEAADDLGRRDPAAPRCHSRASGVRTRSLAAHAAPVVPPEPGPTAWSLSRLCRARAPRRRGTMNASRRPSMYCLPALLGDRSARASRR